MKNCKQAAESKCGKNSCCFYCEDKEGCKDSCTLFDTVEEMESEGCEEAFDAETAIQAFQKDEKAIAIMKTIADIAKQKDVLDKKDKEVREALKTKMAEFDVKSFKSDILDVTYVAPTTKTTIDSKKLKEEQPKIYAKYSKTSNVSASVRISVK